MPGPPEARNRETRFMRSGRTQRRVPDLRMETSQEGKEWKAMFDGVDHRV